MVWKMWRKVRNVVHNFQLSAGTATLIFPRNILITATRWTIDVMLLFSSCSSSGQFHHLIFTNIISFLVWKCESWLLQIWSLLIPQTEPLDLIFTWSQTKQTSSISSFRHWLSDDLLKFHSFQFHLGNRDMEWRKLGHCILWSHLSPFMCSSGDLLQTTTCSFCKMFNLD